MTAPLRWIVSGIMAAASAFAQGPPAAGKPGVATPGQTRAPLGATPAEPMYTPNGTPIVPGTNGTNNMRGRPSMTLLNGTVMIEDGSPPPEPVRIEFTCGMRKTETRTDNKGHFDFLIPRFDASTQRQSTTSTTSTSTPSSTTLPPGEGRSSVQQPTQVCSLRATLPGFEAAERTIDSDVIKVSIQLKSDRGKTGYTISLANASAPPEAKDAYDKARKAIGNHDPKEARKYLTKAVAIYPKYPAAWVELGGIEMNAGETEEAKQSFGKALAADSGYLPPYERLAVIALNAQKWQELADVTERLIRLNAYEYPEVYYYNAMANLGLNRYEAAEKSAREALNQDPHKFARASYLLGMMLAKRGEYASAAEQLKAYLAANPSTPDAEKIRLQMTEFDSQARRK